MKHIQECLPASLIALFPALFGITASPRSAMQQEKSLVTKIFLVFISLCVMHGLAKSECKCAMPFAIPKLILLRVDKSRVWDFK